MGGPDLVLPTNLPPAVAPSTPATGGPSRLDCTTLPPSVTLQTTLPALFFRTKMSLPSPWTTAPTRLSVVPGTAPACAFVLATLVVGSVQPMSPITRVAPGAMYTQ